MNKKHSSLPGIILSLLLFTVVSFDSFADSISLKDTPKVFYPTITVQEIENQFQNNAYSANKEYKDSKIALIGEVDSISDNGSEIFLKSLSSQLFVCKSNKKGIKAKVIDLKSNQLVIICGSVDSAESESFNINTENIIDIDHESSYYKNSFVCKDGTILLGSKHSKISLSSAMYSINVDWKSETITESFYDGLLYSLSDNETLKVVSASWDVLEKEANKQDGVISYFTNGFTTYENQILEFWLDNNLDAKYEIDMFRPSTEKIGDLKYIYYSGSCSDKSGKKFEAYFYKTDQNIYMFCYQYVDNKADIANDIVYMMNSADYSG